MIIDQAPRFMRTGWFHRLSSPLSNRSAFLFGVGVVLLYFVFASVRLCSQGLYYDELHQAPAAFAYKGVSPEFITYLHAGRVPLLNMTYSGAIKSNLYGLYLLLFHASFSVLSWRWCGLVFVGIGFGGFCCLARRGLSGLGMLVFAALCLTDGTLLLETRHDWGPVALALMLRLFFLGVWIRGQTAEAPSQRNSFLLAMIVGISLFEKLSNVVLILPLVLLLGMRMRQCGRSHLLAGLAGGIVGALPLIGINLITFARHHVLISFAGAYGDISSKGGMPNVTTGASQSFPAGPLQFFSNYFATGSGTFVKAFILGGRPITLATYAEIVLMLAILLPLALLLVARRGRENRPVTMAALLLLCYLAVMVGLKLLPRSTYMHHWVIGTPFQYAAIALGIVGLQHERIAGKTRPLKIWFCSALCVLLCMRMARLVSLEKALLQGSASVAWDHSHTEIGEFARAHAPDSFFVASDWGVTTSIYCLADGQPHLVYEPYWSYHGLPDLQRIVDSNSRKCVFYLVRLDPCSNIHPEETERIEHDVCLLRNWKEVAVEPELAHLRGIHVRKFVQSALASNPL